MNQDVPNFLLIISHQVVVFFFFTDQYSSLSLQLKVIFRTVSYPMRTSSCKHTSPLPHLHRLVWRLLAQMYRNNSLLTLHEPFITTSHLNLTHALYRNLESWEVVGSVVKLIISSKLVFGVVGQKHHFHAKCIHCTDISCLVLGFVFFFFFFCQLLCLLYFVSLELRNRFFSGACST